MSLFCLLLAACTDGSPEPVTGPPSPSAAVPATVVSADLAGLEAALERNRGKAVLLNFWAIWCAPCVAELPDLAAVHREFVDRGGVVLGVSYDAMLPGVAADEAVAAVREFIAARTIPFDQVVYTADDYAAIDERFALPGGVPVTLAFDRAGNIVDRQHEAAGRSRFTAMMERALSAD